MPKITIKEYKSFSKKLLLGFFLILFVIILLNISVDPFKIFNFPLISKFNEQKPELKRQQRITKIVEMKLDKNNLDAIFLGSSRVDGSISEELFYALTNKRIKNLGMNALSHSEMIKVANNAILVHPEIQTIYVGLDFFRFLKKNADNKRAVTLSNNPNLTISEFNPIILSLDTIISSVNTITANITYKQSSDIIDYTPAFERSLRNYTENYYQGELALDEFDKLLIFQKDMKSKGYNVVFYTNPTHASDLSLIKQSGALNVFIEWKYLLAQHFDYVDFDFVNNLTGKNIGTYTKYFFESSHCSPEMGNIILNNLIKNNNNYGIKITKNNVNKYNFENTLKLNAWEKENQQWVTNIQKYIKEYKQELKDERGNNNAI